MKRIITTITYSLLFILFITSDLQSKTFPFIFEQAAESDNMMLGTQKAEAIVLNTQYAEFVFATAPQEILFENFPVSFGTLGAVKLNLTYNSLNANSQLMTVDDKGLHAFVPNRIVSYYGQIDNEPNSKVFLTYSAGNIFAVIQHQSGETFSISPEYRTNKMVQAHFLTAGNGANHDKQSWLCLTEDATDGHLFSEDMKHLNDIPLSPSKLIDVKVACEATAEFFHLFSDLNKATAYITSVIAQTSKIYEDNINVRLTISYMLIWQKSELDPYKNAPYLNDKLSKMPQQWKNKEVTRSIAVLFASLAAQPGGTYVAGIAYGGLPGRGNLCNSRWGYCVLGIRGGVNFPTTNYSWDVNVAAHEIGHLFGAPHTHRCYWNPPIDTCVSRNMEVGDACFQNIFVPRPGTIMSYCHLTNPTHSVQLFFHKLQKPLMRKAAVRATCNKVVAKPYVSLLNPLGGKIYRAGDIVPLRWTASNVNRISLKYSLDAGKNWLKIADNINVNDSIYNWKSPIITNNQVLVLIHKSSDISVRDESMLTFGIFEPAISVIEPQENDEFARNKKILITWSSIFINSLKIEFTSDGGSNWTPVVNLGKSNRYEWILPDIESEQCKFRITSLDETNVIAESSVFKVGTPFAELITPQAGISICKGKKFEIRWNAKFIKILYLKYSLNNGDKWKKITPLPLKAENGKYVWRVKQAPTKSAKIKIVTRIDGEEIVLYESTGTFEIKDCPDDVENSNGQNSELVTLSPQPVSDFLNVDFAGLNSRESIRINIYTTEGKLIRHLNCNDEKNRIRINTISFPSGTYVLILSNERRMMIKKFNIIR